MQEWTLELLRKATLDLDIDALEKIKVEKDMLQLQLK